MKLTEKQCPKCGTSVNTSEKFCVYCGYRFPSDQSSENGFLKRMRSSFEQGKERGQAFGNFVMGNTNKKAKVICPKCNSANNEGQQFCIFCGCPISAVHVQSSSPAKENSSSDNCPNCGRFVKPGDSFCIACGTRIERQKSVATKENICPSCGNPIKPGQSFCTACGTRIEDTKTTSQPKPKNDTYVSSFDSFTQPRNNEPISLVLPESPKESEPIPQASSEPITTCPSCGSVIKPDHAFCTVCGTRIEELKASSQPEPKNDAFVSSPGSYVQPRNNEPISLVLPGSAKESEPISQPSSEPITTCPSCGNPIKPGHSFCTACGTRIEEPKASSQPEPKNDAFVSSPGSYVQPRNNEPISLVLPGSAKESEPISQPSSEPITTCPSCGNPIKPGYAFCTICGTRIEETKKEEDVAVPSQATPKDDAFVPSHDSFTQPRNYEPISLVLPESPKESEPIPQASSEPKTCPSCGNPIKPGFVFCTLCGTRIEEPTKEEEVATPSQTTPKDDDFVSSLDSFIKSWKDEPISLVLPETSKESDSLQQSSNEPTTCPSCGSPLKPGYAFCTICGMGVDVTPDHTESVETPPEPTPAKEEESISLSFGSTTETPKQELEPISLILPDTNDIVEASQEPEETTITLSLDPSVETTEEEPEPITRSMPETNSDDTPLQAMDESIEEEEVLVSSHDKCPYCGTPLLPEAAFCPECGNRIDNKEILPTLEVPTTKVCRACQKTIDYDSIFCKYCGTRCEEEEEKPMIPPQPKEPVVIEEENNDPDVESKHRLKVPVDGSTVVAPCGAKITLGGRNAAFVRELTVSKHIFDGERTRYDINADGVHELDDFFTINLPYTPVENHGVIAQYYNTTSKEWELIDHDVDKANREVVIHTNHLSGFAVVDVSNSNETNVTLASMAHMYLSDDVAWNDIKERMNEEKTAFKQDPVAMAFFYYLMGEAIELESYHFISQEDVDKAIKATFGNLSNFNDIMGWISSFAYDIACYKEIIPQAVLEFAATGSEIYLPGKLIEIGANFATWLSAASIAETAYRESVENGKVSEGTIWDMYKWLNSYSFGYIIGKLGTSFGSLYALPVLLVDYSLTKIRSTVQDAENDALSKALYYFYKTECARPMLKKQERVKVSPISGFPLTGKDAGVEVESWQTRITKIHKSNAKHHNGDPKSLASTINAAIYHDMTTACQKLIDLANKGQGDMEIAISGGVHDAEMRNLWSTVKDIKETNKDDIIAKAIALLEKDMRPAFEAVAEEQRRELRQQATAWANTMNTTLNYTHTLTIEEFVPAGETHKYAGHKVIFTRSDKKTGEDDKITPTTVQWQGTLDANGSLTFTFNTFGYMKAGAPNRIEIYAPQDDPKHANPLEKVDFEIKQKVTHISIGGVENIQVFLADIFINRYYKEDKYTHVEKGFTTKNFILKRTNKWAEVEIPAIEELGDTIEPMRFLLDLSKASLFTRNTLENLPNDHYLLGNQFLTYPDTIKIADGGKTRTFTTTLYKPIQFEKGFAPFFESGRSYTEMNHYTMHYLNIFMPLEEHFEDKSPNTFILDIKLVGLPLNPTEK